MEGKKILYVTTEMLPYFPENPQSELALALPRIHQAKGDEVRVFMPRFGTISERRHHLHEVIRLSGMNLIINDLDQPLIIKVASVRGEKLQVYFIDNEEYFKRKSVYKDNKGNLHEDNDERAIFFAKGVLETVKKLNWRPDVVHVLGWMSAMFPVYIKRYYKDDPFFSQSKVIYSVFNKGFEGELNPEITSKLAFDGINGRITGPLKEPNFTNLTKLAVSHSDAVLVAEEVPDELNEIWSKKKIPTIQYNKDESFNEEYLTFVESKLIKN